MKKQVVKSMSVGLSAITLASSMSATAFAEELPEVPATTEAEVAESVEATKVEAPMNAEASKAIGEAVKAIDGVENENNVKFAERAKDELADIANEVKGLDDLNRKATEAVDKYNDLTDKDDQEALDLLADNAATEQAKAQAEAAKGGNVSVADAQHQVSVAADAVTATEAAKNQAELDVNQAKEAYAAAEAAVEAAKEKLSTIEKEYFGKYGYKDDVKDAYLAALAVVNQAQGVLTNADDNLRAAKKKQNDAYFAYETAKTVAYYTNEALKYANANVTAKEAAKKVADDNYTKAENAANKAADDVNAITEIISEDRETLKDAVKAVNDCANIISEKDAEIRRLYGERQQQVNKQKEAATLLNDAKDAYENALKMYGPDNAEVKKLKADADKYAKEVEDQGKIVSDCETLIKGLEDQKKPLEDELKEKTQEVEQLEKDLQQLYLDVLGYEKNEEKLAELNRLNDEVERTSGVVSTLNGEVTTAQGKIDAANIANPDHEQFTNYGKIIKQQKSYYDGNYDLNDNSTIVEDVLIKNYYAKLKYDVSKLSFERHIATGGIIGIKREWNEKQYIAVKYNGKTIGYFNYEVLNTNKDRINNGNLKNTDDLILYLKSNSDADFSQSTRVGSLKELESNIEAYGKTIKDAQDKIVAANAKLPQANKDVQNATSEYNNYADKEGLKAITDVKKAFEDAQKTLSDTRQLISDNSKTKSEKETYVLQLGNTVSGLIQQIKDQTTAKNAAADKKDAADKLLQPIKTTLEGYERTVNEKNQAYTNAINEHGYNSEEAKALRTEIGRIDKAIENATITRNNEAKKKPGLLLSALDAYDTLDWHENYVAPYLTWAKRVADNNLLKADIEKRSKNFEYESAKASAAMADLAQKAAAATVKKTASNWADAKAKKEKAQSAYNTAKANHAAAVSAKNKVVDAINAVADLKTQAGVADTALESMKKNLEAIVASYDASVKALATTQANLTEAYRLQAIRDEEQRQRDNEYYRQVALARAAMAKATETASLENVVIADAAVPTAAPTRARRAAAVATTTIEDEQTPLAGDTTETVEAEDSKDEVATIADEKAPLAAAPKSLFAKTWWAWLLLAIALIGGAVAYSKKRVEDKLNK